MLTFDNDFPASVQNTRARASSAEVDLLFFHFGFRLIILTRVSFESVDLIGYFVEWLLFF